MKPYGLRSRYHDSTPMLPLLSTVGLIRAATVQSLPSHPVMTALSIITTRQREE